MVARKISTPGIQTRDLGFRPIRARELAGLDADLGDLLRQRSARCNRVRRSAARASRVESLPAIGCFGFMHYLPNEKSARSRERLGL